MHWHTDHGGSCCCIFHSCSADLQQTVCSYSDSIRHKFPALPSSSRDKRYQKSSIMSKAVVWPSAIILAIVLFASTANADVAQCQAAVTCGDKTARDGEVWRGLRRVCAKSAVLWLCSEVTACNAAVKPSSCDGDRVEAARACAEAAYPAGSAAYIHLDYTTLTNLVQGKGRYKDYRIPLDKACAIARFMDPASTLSGASKEYMGLVVYAGAEDTMRQAELTIKLEDKSKYLNKMSQVYGVDPSSMGTLADLSGQLASGTGLGDVMELVVKSMGTKANTASEKVTTAFQRIADVLAIKKDNVLVPMLWYSNPADKNSGASVPTSCSFPAAGRKARAAPACSAGEGSEDLFTELLKVEMPAQTLRDVTSSDAASLADVPAVGGSCGRCYFKPPTSSSCKRCPPGTYQASDTNKQGAGSCKQLQCWANENTEPSFAVVQARLPCTVPAQEAAAAAKSNKHIAAQQGANAIKKMFNKLSVSLGPAAASKFAFAYQFPTSVEAVWAPEAGSVDVQVRKVLSILLPRLTIRTNALAGVPLLSSPQSKFNGMSGGSDEFKANFALHQFGGAVGAAAEAKALDAVLLNSARSVDIELDWKAVDELVEIASDAVTGGGGSTNNADDMFQADVSLTAKIYNIKGTSTPKPTPCTTFCEGILDETDATAWSAAFPEDGYNDWVHGYGPSVKQWPKLAQMFGEFKQKVRASPACAAEQSKTLGLPASVVAMFVQEKARETLRHKLWLNKAKPLDRMRACTMMVGAKLKHGSNMMSPPWETTELTHDGRGASGYNKAKALAKYGTTECSMPMFRKAAFCTRTGTTNPKCSAIAGCAWTKGDLMFNGLNPSATQGSCHIAEATMATCANIWKSPPSMAWSMPETYAYVDGQILGGRNKAYGNRALPRLFVFAEPAKPREVELNVNGDFVFQFPKGSNVDKKPAGWKESENECPAAGNSRFIKVPIKVTGSKTSLASPAGSFFDPWGNGKPDTTAADKYTYKACIENEMWKSVLNEVMYMFSPNYGTPAAKAITLNEKGEQLSSTARKHSKTVYDAVNSRWVACTHGARSQFHSSTRCSETMPADTKAKWQEWLYDTKVSSAHKRQVMLPRRPATSSSGGSLWKLQMQIPDVSIESVMCLAGRVDPVLEIGAGVQAAKAELESEQAGRSAAFKAASTYLNDPNKLAAAIQRGKNIAKMLTDGWCLTSTFSSERNFVFSFKGWKKSLDELGVGLPPSLRQAFGIVNDIEVDLGAKIKGPCIQLSLNDMTALAAKASAKIEMHAKVDASATLPRLSFRETPPAFKIPLEDPTPDLCGGIFLSDLLGSVGWRTEFAIAVRWSASGSLESNTATIKMDLAFLASLDVKIADGKIEPIVDLPKEWPTKDPKGVNQALPTITMKKPVEGKGQLRVDLILDVTLFVFPTKDKEYGKDQTKCATDGKGGTTNVKGTVTLGLVCDADLGKMEFGCKPYFGAAAVPPPPPGRHQRALGAIQGNLGGVDVTAEVNFPMCVGDSEGKVILGEKTVDIKSELITRYPFLQAAAAASGLTAFTITVKSWVEDACGVFSVQKNMNPMLAASLVAKGSFDLNLDVKLKVDENGVLGGKLCIPLDELSKTKTLTLPMGLPAVDFAFLTKLKLWVTTDDYKSNREDIKIRAVIKAETSAPVKMVMSKDGVKPEFGVPEVKYTKFEFIVEQAIGKCDSLPVPGDAACLAQTYSVACKGATPATPTLGESSGGCNSKDVAGDKECLKKNGKGKVACEGATPADASKGVCTWNPNQACTWKKTGDRPVTDIPVTFHVQLSNAFAVMESGTSLLDEGCVPTTITPSANLQGMVFAKAEATVLAEISCKMGSNPLCEAPSLPKLGYSLDLPAGGKICLEPKDYVAEIDFATFLRGPALVKAAMRAALGTLSDASGTGANKLDASVTLAVDEACMTVGMANPMDPSLSLGLSATAIAKFHAKATVPTYATLEKVPWVCIPVAGDPITGVYGMPKIFERLGFASSRGLRYTIATALRIRAHGDKHFWGMSVEIKAGAQVAFRMAGDISKKGVKGTIVGPHLTVDDDTGITFTGFPTLSAMSNKTKFPDGATVTLEVELLTALTLSEDGRIDPITKKVIKNVGSVMPFCGADSGSSTPTGAFGSMVGSVGLTLTCKVDRSKTLGIACSTILKPMVIKKRHRGFTGSLSDTTTLSSAGMFASLQYRHCEPKAQVFFDVRASKEVNVFKLLGAASSESLNPAAVTLSARLAMGAPAHSTCFGFSLSDPSTPTLNMGFNLETSVDFSASLRLNGVRDALACIDFAGASTRGIISLPQSMGGASLMEYAIATTVHVTIKTPGRVVNIDGLTAELAFSAMVRNKLSLDIAGSDIEAALVPTIERKTITFKMNKKASVAGLSLPFTFTANVKIVVDGSIGSPGSTMVVPRCSHEAQQKQRESTAFAVVSAMVNLAVTCTVSSANMQDVSCTMADPKGDVVAVIPSAKFQWGQRIGRSGGRSRRLSASEPERIVDLTGDVPAGTASVRFRDGSLVHGSRSRRSEIATSGSFAKAGLILDFEFKGTAYSVSLELAPSLFEDGAKIHHGSSTTLASLHEPATYKTNVKTGNTGLDHAAVITVGESGQISGVVFSTNGDQIEISNNGGANSTVSVAESKLNPNIKCGNARSDDNHTHEHVHESGSSGTRGRRASEPWFGNNECFTGDATKKAVKMGLAFTKRMYDKVGGTDELAEFWIADILAKTNMLYETQLNIILIAGDLYFSKGDQTWDNKGCTALWNYDERYPDIDKQLALLRAWPKPSRKALWHVFDDCFAPPPLPQSGTAGLAWLRVLCKGDGGTGVSYDVGDTWKTFAHEVGHNFGGEHSFEEGMKLTGGIMDYADGVYNGVIQFNTKYRKTEVCAHIKSSFDNKCDGMQVAPYQSVCGDGVADLSSGETCECASKTQSCRFCIKCKLTAGKECTPDDFALPAQACCKDDGMFAVYGSDCNTVSGHPGMCNAGNCLDARQSLLGLMGNKNPLGLLGPFDGLKIRKCDDVTAKTKTWELKPSVLADLLASFTEPVFRRLDAALVAANQVMVDLKKVLALAKAAAAQVAAVAASCAATCAAIDATDTDAKAACSKACTDAAAATRQANVDANAKVTAQATNVATASTQLGENPTGSMINKLGKFSSMRAWLTIQAESACAEASMSNALQPRISVAVVLSLGIKLEIKTFVPKLFQPASICSAENALPLPYSAFKRSINLPMKQLGTLNYGVQTRVCFEMEGTGDLKSNEVTLTVDAKALFKIETTMAPFPQMPSLMPAGIQPGTQGQPFLKITSGGEKIKEGGIRGRITIDTRLSLEMPQIKGKFGDGPFLVVSKAFQVDVSCSYTTSGGMKCDAGYTFIQPHLQPNSPMIGGSLATAFKPVSDLFTSFPTSLEDLLKQDPKKLSNALLMVWGNVAGKPNEATDQCGRFARSWIRKSVNLPLPAANVFVAQVLERFLPMGMYNTKIAVESSVTGCEPKANGFTGCAGLDKAACTQNAKCKFTGMNWKTFQESLMCDWSMTTDVEIPFVGRVPFSKKINMFNRCNGGTRQRRTTGGGYLVDLDNNDTVISSVRRRAATNVLTSVAFGFELPNLPDAFKAIFGKVPAVNPEKIHKILESMLGTAEIGLIVSNVPIGMEDTSVLPDMPSLATLPQTFKFVPGVTMFAVLSTSQCASDDMICSFVKENFPTLKALFLSMTIGFEPSATATVGLGGVTLKKDDRCASTTAAAKVEIAEASVFIRAGRSSLKHGVRVALNLELGDPKAAGKCDAGAMVRPLTFKGEFVASLPPKLSGKLTMDGIYYQAFGLKMLHFAELEANLAVQAPFPIPTAFEAIGTLAIGEKCYLKDATTQKITDNPNRGSTVEGKKEYCVLAQLALGFDALDPRQTYVSATLESFNVETMVNLFAPAGTAAQVFGAMPTMVAAKVKESGFMGATAFSFTASPFGATDLTGNSIPGGLRMEGTFNFMGWSARAKVIVVPFMSMYIDMVVDPLNILGGAFKLQTGYEQGCSPKAPALNAVYYAKAKTHCQKFADKAKCESTGPRPTKAAANAAAGDVATDSQGRKWTATARQSGNAAASTMVWMPKTSQATPFVDNPQCQWHGADEGPHFLLDLGFAGDIREIQTLAAAGVNLMHGELPDISTLLSKVKFNLELSGKVSLLGASAASVMKITKTQYNMVTKFNNFLAVPSLKASLTTVADVSETPAFRVAGTLVLADLLGEIKTMLLAGLRTVNNALMSLTGDDGPLSRMAVQYTAGVEALAYIREDNALGPCLAAPIEAAIAVMDAILTSDKVPALYVDNDAVPKVRVTTIPMLIKYASDKLKLVTGLIARAIPDECTLKASFRTSGFTGCKDLHLTACKAHEKCEKNPSFDMSSIISMSASFDVQAGDMECTLKASFKTSGFTGCKDLDLTACTAHEKCEKTPASSADFAFTGTLFGTTAKFDANFKVATNVADQSKIKKAMYDKLVKGCAAFIADILTGATGLNAWFAANLAAVRNADISTSMTTRWNAVVRPGIQTIAGGFATSVTTANTAASVAVASSATVTNHAAMTTATRLLTNVGAIPEIANGPISAGSRTALSARTTALKTGIASSIATVVGPQTTLQGIMQNAADAVRKFATLVSVDTVDYEFVGSGSAKKFKLFFIMTGCDPKESGFTGCKDLSKAACTAHANCNAPKFGFELGGRRRRDLVGIEAAGTELRLGRRSTASDCANIVAGILAQYVPAYQTFVTTMNTARAALDGVVATAGTALANFMIDLGKIEVVLPVIQVTGLELYKSAAELTKGPTFKLNAGAIVTGEPTLLASANVYAKFTWLNSNTQLSMSTYSDKFDFNFDTTNVFGIPKFDGGLAIEWRKSNGLKFNFLLDAAGRTGRVAGVIAEVKKVTDAASVSALATINGAKTAVQTQANNLCGLVFSAGTVQTYCNTIISVGFGSALKEVFNFVEQLIQGVIDGVNTIVSSVLNAGGKIFSMTKLRLLGSFGGQKTAIGAEIDFAVSGTAQPKWTGTLNLADVTAAMDALSTILYNEVAKVTPALKDGATQLIATIGAKTATASAYATEAKGVVSSAFVDAEMCTWNYYKGAYWCDASQQYWDGGYASSVAYSAKSTLRYREWTSQQGLIASGYTAVKTREQTCVLANPIEYTWAGTPTLTSGKRRGLCLFSKVKKPEYPSTWPQDAKPQFEALINSAWGGRRMRKSENAKLFENIRRISAANVVEEWTARTAAMQGQALRDDAEGNGGQSQPFTNSNTTATAKTPDF